MNEINSLSWYARLIGIVSGVTLVSVCVIMFEVSLDLVTNMVTKGRRDFFSAVDTAVVDIRYQTVGLALAFTALYGFGILFGWKRTWTMMILIGPPFTISTLRLVRGQIKNRRSRTIRPSPKLEKYSGEPTSLANWYRFLEWFTQAKPVIGYVTATVGCVLAYSEIAGQDQTTFAVLDPYVAVLMVWSLAAFAMSFHDYENTEGERRVLATAGVLLAGFAVVIALLQVLIVMLFAVSIPFLQKKGRRW